jgi:hypothetical protein
MAEYIPKRTRFPKRVQTELLNTFLAAVHRRTGVVHLGVPGILFPEVILDEACLGILQELERFQDLYGIGAEVLISTLQQWGYQPDESTVKTLRDSDKARGDRLRSLLREQTRREEAVQALNPPIQFFPKSLHPDRITA